MTDLTTSVRVTKIEDQDFGAAITVDPAPDAGIDVQLTGIFEVNADVASAFEQGDEFEITLTRKD